jgi:hypothetical protein
MRGLDLLVGPVVEIEIEHTHQRAIRADRLHALHERVPHLMWGVWGKKK